MTTAAASRWTDQRFGSSTAFVSLSPGLVCVLSAGGRVLTHQDVGGLGLTAHQAWNAAAHSVASRTLGPAGMEIWVRSAAAGLGSQAPRGYEVRATAQPPAHWLSHPRLFTLLHRHFTEVLTPSGDLTYLSRDCRELYVFDASPSCVHERVSPSGVIRYSLGFPLLTPSGQER